MSEALADKRQHKTRLTPLRLVLGLAIVVLLIANLIDLPTRAPSGAFLVICKANLRTLHDAFRLYA